MRIFNNYLTQLTNDLKMSSSKNILKQNLFLSFIFNTSSNSNTSYNTDDFLLEIEHLNMQINNREKQMQSGAFKVCFVTHIIYNYLDYVDTRLTGEPY